VPSLSAHNSTPFFQTLATLKVPLDS